VPSATAVRHPARPRNRPSPIWPAASCRSRAGRPTQAIEIGLQQLAEDLAGCFVLVWVAASSDPPGTGCELVDVGPTKGQFDGLGYLICVSNGQSGKRTVFDLVDRPTGRSR